MWASSGCDMASFHASYRAKANLELIELARSLIVNLRVVRAPANYLVLSITAIHRWEGESANERHHKVLFISRYYNSQAVSLAIYTDIFPLLRCCQAAFTVIREHSQMRLQCSRSQIQAALLGCIRPTRLPGPFMETVLGLIIPSCASSPSPAGLCVPVSSAKTPESHQSQGETAVEAHTWWLHASLDTFKV